jgi:putative transcriptional regulator
MLAQTEIKNGEKMIYSRLKVLIAEKELKAGRRLTYRTIAKETGVSTSTLVRLVSQNFDRIDVATIETLCRYFDCQPGDLIRWDKDDPWERASKADEIATDEYLKSHKEWEGESDNPPLAS